MKQLSAPEQIINQLPVSENIKQQVEKDRQEIKEILDQETDKKLLILGPCSAWPSEAVTEYAKKIKPIAEKVKDKIKIVMRVYVQKPRTTTGWPGPMIQPDPLSPPDIEKGILYSRKLMLEILNLGLPVATEFLFTNAYGYFEDIVSWSAIGARSGEDHEHRMFASLLNHPVGLKNPTSGDIKTAVNSIIATQNPHTFIANNQEVTSKGNLYAHLVLRGGNNKPNTDIKFLKNTFETLNLNNIEKGFIIDMSHDNSINPETNKKDPLYQPEVLKQILEIIKQQPELPIVGFMVESFIKTGRQEISNNPNQIDKSGLSITDACLGFEETQEMIEEFYEGL